jgi:hypothetical protein
MGHSTRVTGFIRLDDGSLLPPLEPPLPVDVTAEGLAALLARLADLDASPRCAGMIRNLAVAPPVYRLLLNLKAAMLCLSRERREPHGLTPDEEEVLREIDAAALSEAERRVVYSLFSLRERAEFIGVFGDAVGKARTQKGGHIVVSPIGKKNHEP